MDRRRGGMPCLPAQEIQETKKQQKYNHIVVRKQKKNTHNPRCHGRHLTLLYFLIFLQWGVCV